MSNCIARSVAMQFLGERVRPIQNPDVAIKVFDAAEIGETIHR